MTQIRINKIGSKFNGHQESKKLKIKLGVYTEVSLSKRLHNEINELINFQDSRISYHVKTWLDEQFS